LDILKRALDHRAPVFVDTDAYRWLDADASPHGATIERFGAFAVFNAYTAQAAAERRQWAEALLRLGVNGVYYKHRVRDDLRRIPREQVAPATPLLGEPAPAPLLVSEHGLRFEVRLGDGLSTGLFLDQRDNRQRIRGMSANKRVLNLFCYTGSFSVAAGVGGAKQVTSVDLAGAVLRRVAENLVHNALDPAQHRLLRADCVNWVDRALRRGDTYDIVILDPPSFGSNGSKTWSVARDYFSLVEKTLQLVAPGGTALCVTNHRGTSEAAFTRGIADAARSAGRAIASLTLPEPPLDCRPVDGPMGGGSSNTPGQGATKSAMVTLQ
jgi:23S rRNA (cytosine1962-C5)-methyltransferase